MAVLDRAALKLFFETGDKPTQAEFADLIDSLFALADPNSVQDTIVSAVPILGTGAGGQIIKRGVTTYSLTEFSDNEHWFTTDGGSGLVGAAAYFGSSFNIVQFDGLQQIVLTAALLTISHVNSSIKLATGSMILEGAGPGSPRIELDSNYKFANMPAFADDAAAGVGGLVIGDAYQTDGTGAAPLNVAGIVVLKQ